MKSFPYPTLPALALEFKASLGAVSHALIACSLTCTAAFATVCDRTYYMQASNLYILTGATTTSLSQSYTQIIGKELGGVEVIHPETEYEVVTKFDAASACAEYKKTTVDYMVRKKPATGFTATTVTTHSIKLNAGIPYPFAKDYEMDYWFGIASGFKGDTALIVEAIGKHKTKATGPEVFYGAATMTKVIKDKALGTPKSTFTGYYRELSSNPDSTLVLRDLLTNWKDEKDNDTQTVSFKVQLLKIKYDSLPPTTKVAPRASAPGAGFQASQTGNMVLIRPADGKAVEALGLFNMLGHKVATLHPTGYLYQWNGRTAAGEQAQTGVYFVQSGARVLGKFFYSR